MSTIPVSFLLRAFGLRDFSLQTLFNSSFYVPYLLLDKLFTSASSRIFFIFEVLALVLCLSHALLLVLFLSRPPNRVRKCLCKVRSLNIVVSIGRDDVGISLFLGDKVYKFRPKITNYNILC